MTVEASLVAELAELQRRFGGPGWLRRLQVDVFEDRAAAPGSIFYFPEFGRIVVHDRWDLELALHLAELDHAVRRIYDDALVRLARFAGVPYERTMLRSSQRARL